MREQSWWRSGEENTRLQRGEAMWLEAEVGVAPGTRASWGGKGQEGAIQTRPVEP